MKKTDYSSDFDRSVETWKRKHGVREDDAVLLCVELFRIHQVHWDQIRHEEMPAFQEFRDSILKLTEAAKVFQRQSALLLDQLRQTKSRKPSWPIFVTVIVAACVGIAIGKFAL